MKRQVSGTVPAGPWHTTLIIPSRCADCPPLCLMSLLRRCPRHAVQGDLWQWNAARRIKYSSAQRHRLRVDQSAREWEYVDPYGLMEARTPGLPDHGYRYLSR